VIPTGTRIGAKLALFRQTEPLIVDVNISLTGFAGTGEN
jgi:hypothetical protein